MNSVNIIGRLTADPEVRETRNEKLVANYRLAVDRAGSEDADFVPVVVFGNGAEFCEKYLKKGMRVAVSGEIRTERYEDKDGNTKYSWNVMAWKQYFADSKKDDENDGNGRRRRR